MKKAFTVILLLMLSACFVFAFGGCGTEEKANPPDTETSYTVTFNSDGGSSVASQTVKSGGKVVLPAEPTKITSTTEFRFEGWYYGNELWDFAADTVSGNMTLVARWKAQEIYTPEFLPSD